ncbi:hypothetical protein SAMN06265222_108117 [Neorhodopirellula lusitana]|uniref:Uncharacterized protein n=1 Tax=Neorhodopirellula lusitana TaxID=445327 RepID=A0ABY1Q948_9BACT|nr:hypothetical protein SAMN06265222_108117 [Neorhodopirellula lusitana]
MRRLFFFSVKDAGFGLFDITGRASGSSRTPPHPDLDPWNILPRSILQERLRESVLGTREPVASVPVFCMTFKTREKCDEKDSR